MLTCHATPPHPTPPHATVPTSPSCVRRRAWPSSTSPRSTLAQRHRPPRRSSALAELDGPLPDGPGDPTSVIALLARVGGPATMATTGPDYFGFVNGATFPVALGDVVARRRVGPERRAPGDVTGGGRSTTSPAAGWSTCSDFAGETGVAFVSGATVANATCLAAARDALLAGRAGTCRRTACSARRRCTSWSASRRTRRCRKSLGLVGLGRDRVTVVPADDQGRMRAELLPDLDRRPVLVCAQAGEVNTRRVRPVRRRSPTGWPSAAGWLHVDGAFGLWALADPARADLVARPRPGRLVGDRRPQVAQRHLRLRHRLRPPAGRPAAHVRRRSPATSRPTRRFEAMHHTPQSSQRARQVEVWAVLRTLGRDGVADAGAAGLRLPRAAIAERLARRRADDPQRRRAQPGARPARRRADDRGADRRDPGATAASGAVRPSGTGRRRCGSACRRGRPPRRRRAAADAILEIVGRVVSAHP